MNDELKSALDLALEKLDREMGDSIPKLSEQQKEQIAETRKKYQSKIAEAEIAAQSDITKARQKGDYQAVATVEKRLADEKNRINTKMEREIAQIRGE